MGARTTPPVFDVDVDEILAACRKAGDRGDHVGGWALADRALALVEDGSEGAAHALALRAYHSLRLGDNEATVDDGVRAVLLLGVAGRVRAQVEARLTLVMAFGRLGLHHEAMDHANAALVEANTLGDPLLLSLAFNRAGVSADLLGDGYRAIDLLEQALALTGSRDEARSERCVALINLAGVARANVARCRERGDEAGARSAAEMALSRGRQAVAGACDPVQAASAQSVLANALTALGRLDEAEGVLVHYRALAAAHGYRPLVAEADLELARLLHLRGRHDDAVAALRVLRDSASFDEPEFDRAVWQLAHRCHRALGDTAAALHALEQDIELDNRDRRRRADARSRTLLREVEIARARAEADQQRRLAIDRAEALAESLVQLQHEIQVRRKAEEAAQAASRAKSVFLATMSHELRTPLNAVIGYTEIVIEDLEDPQHVDDLGKALSAARTLLQLIDDVLDLSRIEAGRVELTVVDLAVDRAVGSALALVAPAASRAGLSLRSRVEDGLRLETDESRLRQVLANLLINAVKYTEQGGIEVVAGRGTDDTVVIEVRDTGIGIEPDLLPRLFQRFEQVDGTSTRTRGGSGLGLALVRELTTRLGGTVAVSSTPGVGSTFTLTFPARRTDDVP